MTGLLYVHCHVCGVVSGPLCPNCRSPFGFVIPRRGAATEQQPIPSGKGVDVAELVHRDIEARCELGVKKYGERLTTHNGRDALADAYQEALDLVMYLRQLISEREEEG